MSLESRTARLLAATSLSLSFGWADIAAAQAPPPPTNEAPTSNGAVPPARVGRLSAINGSVSFHAAAEAGSTAWTAATVNYPVTTGDAVFAQAGGHAEIEVGNDLAALDGGTELDMATLDDTQFVTSEPQGRLFLALGPQAQGAVNTIATPRGVLQLAGQGEYEIVAGDSTTPTTITVVQGGGQLTATGVQLQIAAGQTATITGTDQLSGNVAASGPPDPFLSAMLAELAHGNGALPPSVANMTGCRSLANVGTWRPSPQYGHVWYPPVQAGWTPYREGHWAYVQPWGWTWVDDAPWGFAPFHYGRWIDDGGQWGWVPGDEGAPEADYAEPVYAPALVNWTDIGAAAVAGAAIGALAAGAVGWIPLGPNEPYYPPYRGDRGYFDRINRVDVRNIRNVSITNVHINNFDNYANRRGATLAPRDAIMHGQPMGRTAHDFTPAAFRQARPSPVGHSVLGAPPPDARRGAPGHGPAINPTFFHPQHLQNGRLPFRGAPGQPAQAAFRPGAAVPGGLPGLRPHEQVVTGRPGAPPVVPRPGQETRIPGAAPGRPEPGHAGLVAGAAAGAAGAGLAAHALANRSGPGPVRPEAPRPPVPPHVAPVGRPMPAIQRPGQPAAQRFAPPRPQPHIQAPRPPAPRPPAPRAPAPHFAPPARPAPHFAPPPRPAPHFAPPPRPAAPHFAPPPRPAAPPRPAPRPAPPPARPQHH